MKVIGLGILISLQSLFAQGQDTIGKIVFKTNGVHCGAVSVLTGDTIIPFLYDSIVYYPYRQVKCKLGEKWGIIDNSNNVIIPFEYDYIAIDDSYRYCRARNKDGYKIYDRQTNQMSDSIYKHVQILYHDRLCISNGSKMGIIDSNFNFIIPMIYDSIKAHLFNNEILFVKRNKKWFIYNLITNQQMQCKYDFLTEYLLGNTKWMKAYRSGKCGIINQGCEIIIPTSYLDLHIIDDKYIQALTTNYKITIIDYNCNEIRKDKIDPSYHRWYQ